MFFMGHKCIIVERIQARRPRYFGHVVRMVQHRLPNIALYSRVEGNRVKGRPRKRWLDNVTDDCYHRGWSIVEATHLATDRQRWRTYITYGCHSVPWHRHDNNNKNFDIWQKYSKGSRIAVSYTHLTLPTILRV